MIDVPTAEKHPEMPRLPVVLGGISGTIFLLYLLSATGGAGLLRLFGLDHNLTTYFISNRTLFWVCLGLVWWYSAKVEKQPLLLWRESRQGFVHWVGVLILLPVVISLGLVFANTLVFLITHKTEHSEVLEKTVRFCRAHPFVLFYSVITAGVTEELFFRGYLLPRLELLVRNRVLAIAISSILFGLGHFRYGTIMNVVGPMVIGLVSAVYYDRFRNIKVIIVFHMLWDTAVFYLSFRHH
jgi:membrane protease YdiL (CAAX protease family)